MRVTNAHFQNAFIDAWARLRAYSPKAGPIPGLEWSKRMTRSAGMAYIEEGKIRLSVPLYHQFPEGYILEIVPHELAHVAAWRIFQDPGHGEGWKRCMHDALGLQPNRLWAEARMLQHRRRWVELQESKFLLEIGE